jgi:SAM-dependent methyltransferase
MTTLSCQPTAATNAAPPAAVALSTCPVCAGRLRFHARIRATRIGEVFMRQGLSSLPALECARCRDCGSIWATDGRRDSARLVSAYTDLPGEYWSNLHASPRDLMLLERLLVRHAPGREIWDVGCGDAHLLRHLGPGWRRHGVDLGREAVARCQAAGLDVRVGTAVDLSTGVADAVVCLDVVEHLLQPEAELREMARALRPGGVLLVSTGDAGRWAARLAGPFWEYLHCAGHVSVLSRRALCLLLERAGLHVVHTQNLNHFSSAPLWRWLLGVLRNHWRRWRGYGYRRLAYCHDHQLVLARKEGA